MELRVYLGVAIKKYYRNFTFTLHLPKIVFNHCTLYRFLSLIQSTKIMVFKPASFYVDFDIKQRIHFKTEILTLFLKPFINK